MPWVERLATLEGSSNGSRTRLKIITLVFEENRNGSYCNCPKSKPCDPIAWLNGGAQAINLGRSSRQTGSDSHLTVNMKPARRANP